MEEDIAWIRTKLKWQEEGHKSQFFTDKCGRKYVKKKTQTKNQTKKKQKKGKKEKHEISIFSHHPVLSSGLGLLSRKEDKHQTTFPSKT